LAILLATLVAYWPALNGELLWDDDGHITSSALRSVHGLWRIWFELGATQQYYPLLHSAFWVEHRLWGDAVFGYHLANVILHAISAFLVVRIVRRLSLPGAWLAGLVFALHPVCVESVAWISEQKNTLSAAFYLGAALAFLYFDRSRRAWQYCVATGLFLLAILTKTVTATLPAALLVVIWWQRGKTIRKSDVLPLLPWFPLGISAGLMTAWVEGRYIGANGSDFALTMLQRFLLAGRAMWFYLDKLVWPRNLSFTYPRWTIDAGAWWQYLFPAGVCAVFAGLAIVARRRRGPLATFLIFAGTLFPALGFLNVYPFVYSWVADHFQYLASLAVIIPVASVLTVAAGRLSGGNSAGIAAGAVLLAILGVLTWRQSETYRDAETLYRETAARNPDSFLAHVNLCFILSNRPGSQAEAVTECEAAIRIDPNRLLPHMNLGAIFLAMPGRLADAVAQYRSALRIRPDYAQAHNDLATALAQIPDRVPEAIAELQTALRIQPGYAEAHYNLGNALAGMPSRLSDAIAEYQAALRIRPGYVMAHNNLGTALAQVPGRLDDAIAQYEAALRIQPDYFEAHLNLANVLAQVPGRIPDAIAEYEAALRIRPDFEEARQMLETLRMNAGAEHRAAGQ
jgi:tetratricopeptide (TPR) repeat protein